MNLLKKLGLVLGVLFLAQQAFASPLEDWNHKKSLAVKGYDVTSYFADGPVKGDKKITVEHQGLTYRFASEENKALFEVSPEKYLPQYGGWCATALADGDKVDINPKNYKITDGKLYLFYKGLLGDARKPWLKDEAGLKEKADAQWSKLLAK